MPKRKVYHTTLYARSVNVGAKIAHYDVSSIAGQRNRFLEAIDVRNQILCWSIVNFKFNRSQNDSRNRDNLIFYSLVNQIRSL